MDYFTILLTGISGIFVNNLPLSFSTALAHSSKPPNAKIPGLFRFFLGKNLRDLRKQSTSKKTLRSSLGPKKFPTEIDEKNKNADFGGNFLDRIFLRSTPVEENVLWVALSVAIFFI